MTEVKARRKARAQKVLKKAGKIAAVGLACVVGLVAVVYCCLLGRGGSYYASDGGVSHTRIHSGHSFNYIMNHPGLEGLGENVLPLGSPLLKKLTGPWRLKIMIPFLGKHEETVVDGLNYALEMDELGKTAFIPFYSEAEVAQDASKADTGLLYYKTAEGAPFAVVVPGGGFTMLGVASSAYPYAEPLQNAGYNVFVLKYRVGVHDGEKDKIPASERAAEDMEAAVSYILENAGELGVGREYIVMGSSAGGQVTAQYCTEGHFEQAPAACIMLYPANCQRYDYTGCTVPMYITVCRDDPKIDVAGLDTAVEAMKAAGMTVNYNKFETGGHSFGIGVGTPAEGWMERSLEFAKGYLAE